MMMSLLRFAVPLALASIAIACGAHSSVSGFETKRSTSSTLAVAPGQPGATGVVRGTIFGDEQVAAADASGARMMPDRLVGAAVDHLESSATRRAPPAWSR
jgi:hypothetical protein